MVATTDDLKLTPPLKWAGGKRWLAEKLNEYYAPYRSHKWVEPFLGGMGAVLSVMPETALLNDVNFSLMQFYTWIKRDGLELREVSLSFDPETYYRNRDLFNSLPKIDRLASELFYYLNWSGFNGMCRFNQKGEFNIPMGRYKQVNYAKDFKHLQPQFQQWNFTCGDFTLLSDRIGAKSFLYLDPPYDVEFTTYSEGGFSWTDQVRLVEWATTLDCPVLASNQATERVVELYQSNGYNIEILDAPRSIAANGKKRGKVQEMLAFRK